MLGAIAGFWISLMLFVVVFFVMLAGSVASAFSSQQEMVRVKDGTILRIAFDSPIEERATVRGMESVIYGEPEPQTLENILRAIRAAKEDDRIEGIYLDCAGASAGFATREAILNALKDFQKSGKWIMAYGDSYLQGDYWVASCADYLYLNPVGAVDLRGLVSSIPFFKGLLDKVGIEMQVFKVGTYKSAVEPYILSDMSEANREMTQEFLDHLWGNVVEAVATNRGVKAQTVNQWADSILTFEDAEILVDLKVVDALKYYDEVREELAGLVDVDDVNDLNIIDYSAYLASAKVPNEKSNKNKIVVYYATGDIVDYGQSGISAEKMVPEILELADNDDIDAMVLRVNSGGGSAFASEQIWHALEVFKSKGKTLYVSMGDYAASGGYYISCGADKIYAEPTTLTGSIGIFGLLPCAKELFNDKLGVNFGIVTTNANGAFPSLIEPATPYQGMKMQQAINRGYELFTSRCAEGRHMSQDSIKAIGEGRVWDGLKARKIGLVDEMGGLYAAIKALASAKGYKDYEIVTYPILEKTIWDIFAEMQNQTKARAIREELGAYYPIYQELHRIGQMAPVQARMMPMTLN